jgi:hypothetical protein
LNTPTLKPYGERRVKFTFDLHEQIALHRKLFLAWVESANTYRDATNRMDRLSAQCHALKLQAQLESSSQTLLGLSVTMESVGLGEIAIDIVAELKARTEALR